MLSVRNLGHGRDRAATASLTRRDREELPGPASSRPAPCSPGPRNCTGWSALGGQGTIAEVSWSTMDEDKKSAVNPTRSPPPVGPPLAEPTGTLWQFKFKLEHYRKRRPPLRRPCERGLDRASIFGLRPTDDGMPVDATRTLTGTHTGKLAAVAPPPMPVRALSRCGPSGAPAAGRAGVPVHILPQRGARSY
jgi:hypothetical protein